MLLPRLAGASLPKNREHPDPGTGLPTGLLLRDEFFIILDSKIKRELNNTPHGGWMQYLRRRGCAFTLTLRLKLWATVDEPGSRVEKSLRLESREHPDPSTGLPTGWFLRDESSIILDSEIKRELNNILHGLDAQHCQWDGCSIWGAVLTHITSSFELLGYRRRARKQGGYAHDAVDVLMMLCAFDPKRSASSLRLKFREHPDPSTGLQTGLFLRDEFFVILDSEIKRELNNTPQGLDAQHSQWDGCRI
ncbi:hypothetical protein B0H19DRAFT_1084190 [Mycena capillaripes]|nr:hypothetical protein B0H19DRAFT_1084190 [Mycena capillaripes]